MTQDGEAVPHTMPVPRLAILGGLAAITGVAVARLTHSQPHADADWHRQLRWWLIVWPVIVTTTLVLLNQSTRLPRQWEVHRVWVDQQRIVVALAFCVAAILATRIWG